MSVLQNCERIHSCSFKSSSGWYFVRSAPGHYYKTPSAPLWGGDPASTKSCLLLPIRWGKGKHTDWGTVPILSSQDHLSSQFWTPVCIFLALCGTSHTGLWAVSSEAPMLFLPSPLWPLTQGWKWLLAAWAPPYLRVLSSSSELFNSSVVSLETAGVVSAPAGPWLMPRASLGALESFVHLALC